MAGTRHYAWTVVARRVAARTVRHVVRDPLILLGLTIMLAALVVGGPWLTSSPRLASTNELTSSDTAAAAVPTEDAAERYMRGLRDRDVGQVFASLSPEMRRSLEQRTGLFGPAAVAALFFEQERRGERIVSYRLVASYETVQGEGLRFYVARAERGGERREVPYTITLAPDGSIAKVE